MSLLQVKNISYTYSEKMLYKNSSFEIYKGEHVGLIGRNGCGKTTLLNMLRGEIIADEGEIKWQKGINVGYLDQYVNINGSLSVLQYLKTAFEKLYDLEKELNEIYEKMSTDFTQELFDKSTKYQNILEKEGFYEIESDTLKVASGLGLNAIGLDKPLDKLSGGQKAKVMLAKLLLQKPEMLLMDEPTNFLDIEHIQWLKSYLKGFKGAFIVISHDFDFLDEITNFILDIEFEKITKYPGNFSKFVKIKDIKRETYIKQFKSQQKEIKKHEEFIAKNRVRASSAKQAQSRIKMLNKMEKIPPPENIPKPRFRFKCLPIEDTKALILKNLKVGYTKAILPRINFEVRANEKVVITGFNGVGKSTLLKTLVGEIRAIGGFYYFSENTKFAYFQQDLKWEDDKISPIEEISNRFPKLKNSEIRKNLSLCGLKSEYAFQPLRTLSGGEQTKVKIAALMIQESNFLILDEPTNHLDVDSKEVLKNQLIDWEGAILLVSHEKNFYKEWCDRVIDIKNNIF